MLSPFASEVLLISTTDITLPPNRCIAASNDNRVLVLGSKNRLAMILPWHTLDCSLIDSDISSAKEKTASISRFEKSSMVIRLLFAKLIMNASLAKQDPISCP